MGDVGASGRCRLQAPEAGPLAGSEAPPVRLTTMTAWSQGFVVGGDQGYLGVFRLDVKGQALWVSKGSILLESLI